MSLRKKRRSSDGVPPLGAAIRIIDSFLSRRDLNNLYNIFDVFLSTTSGEGWGLTTIEAAITKTPLVIPKCTSFPEIFGDNYKMFDLSPKKYEKNVGSGIFSLESSKNASSLVLRAIFEQQTF